MVLANNQTGHLETGDLGMEDLIFAIAFCLVLKQFVLTTPRFPDGLSFFSTVLSNQKGVLWTKLWKM